MLVGSILSSTFPNPAPNPAADVNEDSIDEGTSFFKKDLISL